MCFLASTLKLGLERMLSNRCCHQRFSVGSVMCMYSAPIEPQYVSRSACTISRSVMFSAVEKYVLVALNDMSMSLSVRS